MKCEHCQIVFETETEYRPLTCPFCGRKLRGNRKPSFHETWAQIKAEPLLKSNRPVDLKTLQDILQDYEMAAQEDAESFFSAQTLLQTLSASHRLPSSVIAPAEELPAVQALLSASMDPQVLAYRLKRALQSPVVLENTLQHVVKSETSLEEKKKAIGELQEAASAMKADLETFPALQKFDTVQQARTGWRKALAGQEETGVTIEDPDWLELILSVPMEQEDRVQAFRESLKQDPADPEHIVNLFFRPLKEEEHAFDHQQLLLEDMAAWTLAHPDEFNKQVLQMMEQKMNLRGLHLGLNMLKANSEQLQTLTEPLPAKHYEVMFRQPYEWMASTDWTI